MVTASVAITPEVMDILATLAALDMVAADMVAVADFLVALDLAALAALVDPMALADVAMDVVMIVAHADPLAVMILLDPLVAVDRPAVALTITVHPLVPLGFPDVADLPTVMMIPTTAMVATTAPQPPLPSATTPCSAKC